jgi:hypothetical protein
MSSVTTSVRFELFKDPEILKSICEKIVVPNLELRDILPYKMSTPYLATE